jgi:LysM repeat protein
MKPWRLLNALGAASGLVLAACTSARLPTGPTTATPRLLALPATASPLPSLAATNRPQATPVIIASPTPTATPVTHVVVEGESLLSIALDYGVSLEALQAANPNVQVRFLSIGATLVIPPPEGGAAVSATQLAPPPPQPLALRGPDCFTTSTEGLYCLVEVANPLDDPVENVSARVILAGSDGMPVAQGVGFSAVALLAGHSAAPVLVTFQPAPAVPIAASAVELLTADPAEASLASGRAVLLEVVEHTGQAQGTRLAVSGQVRNASGLPAGAAWVVVTAYDAADAIVGFRIAALPGGLAAQAAQSFALIVDSLGGPIERYAIVAEGRP